MIKDLPELINAGVISEETAEQIREYYRHKNPASSNRLFIVFGILGALLIGSGIILILAHNWDNFSGTIKTILAFIPLVIGQVLCGNSLFNPRLKENITWRESSATFLFFAVGACIAIISQVYNISGSMSAYLLTWMLLCLPLAYILPSSIASLLYIIGITAYGVNTDYWTPNATPHYLYWLLLLLIAPSFYRHILQKPGSNFTTFHHWFLPFSAMIMLGSLQADEQWKFTAVAYAVFFGILYLVGKIDYFQKNKLSFKSYLIFGFLGIIGMCLVGSYHDFWSIETSKPFSGDSPMLIALVALSLTAAYLLFRLRAFELSRIDAVDFGSIFYAIAAIVSISSPIFSAILINLYLLVMGVQLVFQGAQQVNLTRLNLGLLIIAALVTMRFFDIDISFALRGLVFVMMGTGFFMANYWMLKNKKQDE